MTTLTITSKGQVTLRKALLRHLGVSPGEKIEVDELPDGRIQVKASKPAGSINQFMGLLAGKTKKVASIEALNEAVAQSWAGRK